MANHEEEYSRRMQQIDEGLREPKISKKIDALLSELSQKFGCDFKLMYDFFPEAEEYGEFIDSKKIEIPRDVPTMTLGEFISHISNEDNEFKVYIDPLYMRKGVNEINDVLTTTVDDAVIVVPISHNKNQK